MKPFLPILAALTVSACATAPDNVRPLPVAGTPFAGYDCVHLTDLKWQAMNKLASLTAKQNATRRTNAIGIALIGLPVGNIEGGNVSGEIAKVKGDLDALAVQWHASACEPH